MEALVVIFIIIGIFFALAIGQVEKQQKLIEKELNTLNDFYPSQKVIGMDVNSGIAIDEERKKICLIKRIKKNVYLDVLSYRDILSSEVFEDGITVTKTARGSQLAGAVIGGLALVVLGQLSVAFQEIKHLLAKSQVLIYVLL